MILVYVKMVIVSLPILASTLGMFNELREEGVDLSQYCHPLRDISRGQELVDFGKQSQQFKVPQTWGHKNEKKDLRG